MAHSADSSDAVRGSAPERVMVVEDVATTRRMLARLIERGGYDVVEADDGASAWELVRKEPVDLIVTDVQMPRKSGIELLAELQLNRLNVPVIIMTATPSLEAAVECIKSGASDYIAKPVDRFELLGKIHAALDQVYGPLNALAQPAREGDVLGGYHVVRTLGEGSIGVVCLAEKEEAGVAQRYALKIVKVGGMSDLRRQKIRDRFLHEAQAASRISHPHVVRFIEFGLAREESIPYLVTEYFPHPTLKEIMPRSHRLNLEQRVEIIRQVASALSAIHEQGICHRDVKPGNILVDEESLVAKISDFGVARLPESDMTVDSDLMGSPAYMAPEAFSSASVDHRADIFSLGAVAYELWLGRRPFPGQSLAALATQVPGAKPVAPHLLLQSFPPALESILARMLKKKPGERYERASDVERALAARLGDGLRPASLWERGTRAFLRLSSDWCRGPVGDGAQPS